MIPDRVAADDRLIDQLSQARLGDDTELVFQLLTAWRREALAEPARELVNADLALDTIRAAARASRS